MDLHTSAAVDEVFPSLERTLRRTLRVARALDPVIPATGFYVAVKRSRSDTAWYGHAWPYPAHYDHRRKESRVEHRNGRITMSFGRHIQEANIARLFAHELAHLAQFQRGIEHCGYMTNVWMADHRKEAECLYFEGEVLLDMNMTDDYHDREERAAKILYPDEELVAA